MPNVDVVVPCYNYGRFLYRCVNSVLRQEHVGVRVLIIDDASSDDTAEVGSRLAALDSRVEFRRHEVNQGHIATYNEGLLGWAGAEFSLLLSADDMLADGALGRATRLMARHSEVGMTYGMALIIGSDEDLTIPPCFGSDEYQILSCGDVLQYCCQHGNPVPTPTAVVRTKLQHELGGYRNDLPHTGDMEMWMRFATQASIGVLRALQAYYRWHGGNMGRMYYDGVVNDLRGQKEALRQLFRTWGKRIPEFSSWMESMDRRIGEEAFWLASKVFDDGDIEGSRVFVRFAEEHNPDLRWSSKWWRYQTKRLLGQGLWQKVGPSVNRIRGLSEASSERSRLLRTRFKLGQKTGWWPAQC